jgi:hypothetical protein
MAAHAIRGPALMPARLHPLPADPPPLVEADEFWAGVWWVSMPSGRLRTAKPSECAQEIMRLRERVAALEGETTNREEPTYG